MEKILVKNYAAFLPFEKDEKKYKIITDKDGNEIGFEVTGMVTDFKTANQNGQKFERNSYDRFVKEYFEANELNIPIDLMHIRDAFHLAGVAKKFTKKDGGVQVVAFIPKGVYFYNMIKILLENGVLQGFSNYGYINDYDYDRANNEIIVKDFQLISISLVDVPSDVSGKFVSNATNFEGFTPEPITNNLDIFIP